MNKIWMPLLLVALGSFVFLAPSSASAQPSCRVQAVILRPDFVRPGFDKPNMVRSIFDRPTLERATLEKPEVVRAVFDRPTFIRPVFDDPCLKQADYSRSSGRSAYASIIELAEKDSKLAQNGNLRTEIPRSGVVLATRIKSNESAAVGECCGQQPVNREQQHRLYR